MPDPDTAKLDAQLLMAHVLGANRAWLYAHGDHVLTATARETFEQLVHRRAAGAPIAYLTGRQAFWSLDLAVDESTLIPRPETELLVETVLARLSDPVVRIADLGTGSGAIAIALASERPDWQVTATDQSSRALGIAARNARDAGCADIEFIERSWLDGFGPASLDAIVANPPYIRAGDPHLERLRFEPESALVAGADGLDAIREIVDAGYDVLVDRGLLLLEHGFDQAGAVADLMGARGYLAVESLRDLGGHARVTLGQRPAR